jgi:ABC-type uncharacterized transport system involved in gliding motility auxiliary subunit
MLYAIDPGVVRIVSVNLIFSLAAIVFYALTNRASLGRLLSGRSAALGLMEGLMVLGVLGGAVAANYFGSLSKTEWDLTFTRRFTLAQQSEKVAKQLEEKVTITAFFRPADNMRKRVQKVVELYQAHTDQIELTFISPERVTPAMQAKYKLSAQGPKIVVATGDSRQTKVEVPTEQNLTNALIRVAQRTQQKVYFLSGHGEPSIEDAKSDSGYKKPAQDLTDEGYAVSALSLLEQENVPKDATVLVVAGPKNKLFKAEAEAILDWLKRGGRACLLREPSTEPGLDDLLRRFGVDAGDNLIVDPSPTAVQSGYGPQAPIITRFEQHPVTEPLIRNPTALLFYWARSVSPRLGLAKTTVSTLLQTGAESWGETRYREGGTAEQDEDDLPGPVPIAVASSRNTATMSDKVSDEARLVVFGDSSFANNRFGLGVGGNSDLFVNAINWLAGEEDKITIRPKDNMSSRFNPSEMQRYAIMFVSVNLVPLLIVGVGFSVWAVRRRK